MARVQTIIESGRQRLANSCQTNTSRRHGQVAVCNFWIALGVLLSAKTFSFHFKVYSCCFKRQMSCHDTEIQSSSTQVIG